MTKINDKENEIENLSPFVQFLRSELSKKETRNICFVMLKFDFHEGKHFYARHVSKIQDMCYFCLLYTLPSCLL